MTQPITDYTSFFSGAKEAVARLEELTAEEDRLKQEEARTKRELDAEEKALKDEITLRIRKGLAEINKNYDGEITRDKEELTRVRARRDKARNQGVRERIRELTAGKIEENETLKKELNEAFRKQGVPPLYRTRFYYRLFFPHTFGDFLTLLLFVAVCFFAVPCGIYFFAVPEEFRKTFVLVLIYIVSILVFGGIYNYIGSSSKVKYLPSLKAGREVWDQIAANKKAVKRITRQVSRDSSDEGYDLASFDDDIARLTHQINENTQKKQEAVTQFETVTKTILTDELTENARPRIEQISSQHAEALRKLKETGENRQRLKLSMSDEYEVYVGKEFMTPGKLEALEKLMADGTAANLSDAVKAYRNHQGG